MNETTPSYITGVTDSGDETDVRLGDGADAPPRTGVERFDAAYWQALVEQAQAERDAALAQLDALKRQLAESEGRGRGRPRPTHDATQLMHGRRRA